MDDSDSIKDTAVDIVLQNMSTNDTSINNEKSKIRDPAMDITIENTNIDDTSINIGNSEEILDSKDKDVYKSAKIRLEWIGLNASIILPKENLCSKLTSFCKNQDDKDPPETTKPILKSVNGVAEPGSLLAILGASGAGKTTLLNVLSHQSLSKIQLSGSVLVNNKNIKSRMKKISAYIRQEDLFIGTLTVKEHLTFQALLRLGKAYTTEEKKKRVEDVIIELGLVKCQDTVIGVPGRIRGISGGETKRLSFASEIITNPNLLFVDEPTSGLDSFMAESVIIALQKLAKDGKTVLATIHQPSSEVFQLFDRLLLMAEGRNAFFGSTEDAVTFFNKIGHPCPLNYNPADHYIRTLAIKPGSEEECIVKTKLICDAYDEEMKTQLNKPCLENKENIDYSEVKQTYKESWFTQFNVVLWRSTKAFTREPYVNKVKHFQALGAGLLSGLVYLQQTNDQSGIRNINGGVFYCILHLTFSAVMGTAHVFPAELPVFIKENKIAMYRIDVYFLGRTLAELPWHLGTTFLFITIVYWMVGLRAEAGAYFIFIGISILVSQCSLSYGYLISAIAPTISVASALAAPMIMPFLLFGGFFLKDGSIPVYFVWLKVFSWVKYAFAAAQINQWEHFGPIGCKNGTEACLTNGMAVLRRNGYDPRDFNMNIGALVALTIGFRILAFLLVLFRSYRST